MLRVTTGIVKNKKLKSPDIEGFRAIQEKAKLAVFSILGDKVRDAVVLDLFAGSGNMGIEALSRGASWCDFVDNDRLAVSTIIDNLKNTQFTDFSEVHNSEAVKYVANTNKSYDIIFIDPFYKDTSHKFLMSLLQGVMNKDGIIFFFHGQERDINEIIKNSNLEIIDERKFNASYISILRARSGT